MKRIITFASLCAAMALGAQASKLDTQVITATGFKNSLASVADNLYVLDRDAIAEHGYKNLAEALAKVPGLQIVQNGFGANIDMRAQGGSKAVSRVMLLVDGVLQNPADTSHMSHPLQMININDVEQVEIIPGGGAVVYGGGAVGGVVNVITKASKSKDFAEVSLRYGSFKHFGASAAAGVNLSDAVFLNMGFYALSEEGYQRADKHKAGGVNAGVKFFIMDNQSLALNARFSEDKERTSGYLSREQMSKDRRNGGTVTRGFDPTPYPAEGERLVRTSNLDLSANYSLALENTELSLMPFYSKNNYDDGAFVNSRYGAKLRTKLSSSWLDSHLGFDYLTQRGERDSSGTLGDVKKNTLAVFAHETVHIGELLDIAAGARYEHSTYDIYRYSPPSSRRGVSIPAAVINDSTRKENNLAASLVFSLNVTDESKVYAKAEHGFNSPGPFELTDKQHGQYLLNDLKTEKFMNYEIGYKGLIADQYASFAAFLTDTKDETEFQMKMGNWRFENIGKTRRMGLEAALEQNLLDDKLSLYENLSYVHTKIKDDPLHPNHVGQKIPSVSPFSAAVGLNYAFDMGLNLGADYRYESKTYWNFDNDVAFMFNTPVPHLEKKAYGVLDLKAAYKFANGLSLAAYAKNVLGTKYDLEYDTKTTKDGQTIGIWRPAAKQSFLLELKYEY